MAKRKASGSSKMVYYFGKTKTEGKGKDKAILGGKGLNLAEMTSIGLPVPPGFTITTEVCDAYYKSGEKLPKGLMDDVGKAVKTLEKDAASHMEQIKAHYYCSHPILNAYSIIPRGQDFIKLLEQPLSETTYLELKLSANFWVMICQHLIVLILNLLCKVYLKYLCTYLNRNFHYLVQIP